MNVFIFLLILTIYILNTKTRKKLYEGFEESSNNDIDNDNNDGNNNDNNDGNNDGNNNDNFETCNYRQSKLNGKMCNEKWGKPECNNWIKKDNIKLLEDSKKQTVLRGYHSNDFMYEIDYKNYDMNNIEKKNEKLDLDIPRGVHSSFFT